MEWWFGGLQSLSGSGGEGNSSALISSLLVVTALQQI